MHNLLAQLGKDIVHKQHIREPGQRLYLTDPREFSELLKHDAGNKSVKGIDVDFQSIEEICQKNERAFEGMCNLQFLRFRDFSEESNSRDYDEEMNSRDYDEEMNSRDYDEEMNSRDYDEEMNSRIRGLPRGLDYIFQNLRLIEWRYCPMTCLPSNFKTDFLVVLEMRYSDLEKLWEGTKSLQNLKWLNLNCSEKLRELPDLSTATNLQELSLNHCSSLINLPSSIGNATNLQKLDLSYCSSLTNLPSSIRNATNLQKLDLSYCSSLTNLPSSIRNATNIQKLDLSYCSSLINLPSSIRNATNLQKLDLSYCSSLTNLPSSIRNATNLQKLDLSYCSSLTNLPSSIRNATNLQKLDLSYCSSLTNLPSSIRNATNLQKLDLSYCSSLINLPSSIGNATNLRMLYLTRCSSLINLPSSIGNATNLQKLDLSYCSSIVELSFPIENLHKLQRLELRGCAKLEFLRININLESLHTLDLTDCLLLERFPEIPTNISVLNLQGTAIKEFPASIKYCFGLNRLELRGCRKLVSLPQLPDSIVSVDATNCESLERLDCSFQNKDIGLCFENCFKLNQEAKDLIIQAPSSYAILPGTEVPAYFTHRAKGGSLRIKLNEMLLPTFMTFKACVLLVDDGYIEDHDCYGEAYFCVMWKEKGQYIHLNS